MAAYFDARRARAAARLASLSGNHWYLAVNGLAYSVPAFAFSSSVRLEPIAEEPTRDELYAALRHWEQARRISAHINVFTHELVIETRDGDDYGSQALLVGERIANVLSVRTLSPIYVPAIADHSWGTLAAISDHRVTAREIHNYNSPTDFGLKGHNFGIHKPITPAEMQWVAAHFEAFSRLCEQERFRIAVEAYVDHRLQTSARTAIATLWIGIEALMGVPQELSFRVAAYVASFLEQYGGERLAMHQRIREMYKTRSNAVHGSKADTMAFIGHAGEAKQLLADLLCKVIEQGHIPKQETLDTLLFAGAMA